MIIDLPKFIDQERRHWTALESILDRIEGDPGFRMTLEEARTFHYLYQRTSATLAKIITFSAEPEIRRYLESLVARAYGEVHETRQGKGAWPFLKRLPGEFPRTVRRHSGALLLSVAVTLLGVAFGGIALRVDPGAREVLIPFDHLQQTPAERVAEEEKAGPDRLEGHKATFSTYLMTHNIRVSVFLFALGMTWGIGTLILLFYNGVILGAVAADYVAGGQATFLLGWLLPHGSVEIPALLIAGQAGLALAGALAGKGDGRPARARLRDVSGDLTTLVAGIAALLVWAGFVEAFLSQYHAPVVPYALKIGFGILELLLLILFLSRGGRKAPEGP